MGLQIPRISDSFIVVGSLPCCLGVFSGVWITGSPNVLVQGMPPVRALVDVGIVNGCCCPTAMPIGINPTVLINGLNAHNVFGQVIIGCGTGLSITGSLTVI